MDMNAERKRLRDHMMTSVAPIRRETIDLGGGVMGELRQPTVAGRDRIFKQADMDFKNAGKMKLTELFIACILECLFVPGTGEKVFGQADEEVLRSLPPGSFVDQIGNRIWDLLNVEAPKMGKDSAPTTAPGSSSA